MVPGPNTTQGTCFEPTSGHLAQLARDLGHRRADSDAGDRVRNVEPFEIEQLREQHGVLVGRACGHGREPPVVRQTAGRRGIGFGADPHADALLGLRGRVSLGQRIQPDHRLGVPHIDDQQHVQSPSV